MLLISTREGCAGISASAATLAGIAPDGGLFVPNSFPALELENIAGLSYPNLCAYVLGLFYDDIDGLEALTKDAYDGFNNNKTAPVVKIAPDEYMLELWHGPTLAFKDMALSVLPRLMTAAMNDDGKILILVATSGDTGKAALEGFCNVPGTRIVVFYPNGGVSEMQRLQMVTQQGDNTHVMAVSGNFDDTQNTVKDIFADREFAALAFTHGYSLSSANSINFGRLAPQIAYYVGAYAQLLSMKEITLGERINFVVPTGNFGNILAAYYAKRMGLPIARLICASNKNNILTDFFNKGTYSLKRPFYKTMSPSMDILISSNLERLLFELTGRSAQAVNKMMRQLKETGEYNIAPEAKDILENGFFADWCGENETAQSIRDTYKNKEYLIDTHTAVAMGVYEKYKAKGDDTKTVIVSTASPYKFPHDVLSSLGEDAQGISGFDAARKLSSITGTDLPKQIMELEGKPVRHSGVYNKDELKQAVLSVL